MRFILSNHSFFEYIFFQQKTIRILILQIFRERCLQIDSVHKIVCIHTVIILKPIVFIMFRYLIALSLCTICTAQHPSTCEGHDPAYPLIDWTFVREEMRGLMQVLFFVCLTFKTVFHIYLLIFSIETKKSSYFQKMSTRRVFMNYVKLYQKLQYIPIFESTCPMGVAYLRLFVMLLSNDLDRCLELRDNKLGVELFDYRFGLVMMSQWPVFNALARLADDTKAVVYPLPNACDDLDLDDAAQFAYRDRIKKALQANRAPPLEWTLSHIEQHGHPKCGFGVQERNFGRMALMKIVKNIFDYLCIFFIFAWFLLFFIH